MHRILVRLGLAGLLLCALSLPSWAEATVYDLGEHDTVVVPAGWGLEEAMDGWWVYPDGAAGYSEAAHVVIVDDFYNLPFDDPKAQVATMFGYLTSAYAIEERTPASGELPADDAEYAYFTISGVSPATDDRPLLHLTTILVRNPDGIERGYQIEARSVEESLDLSTLVGMLDRSRDFTPDEVEGLDLEAYSFTNAAELAEEDY